MVETCILSDIFDVACAWEVVLEFVEAAGHHSVGQVEGLFHTVSMMDVDVNVQHPLVYFQQFQDSQHAVVDVAEAGCFGLFCMMESPAPIEAVLVTTLSQERSSD